MQMCKRFFVVPVFFAMWAMALPVSSGERVVGWVETARVNALGVKTKAKMDSGALTSSIHATNVQRFRKGDKKWVRFTVSLQDIDSREIVSKTLERRFHRRVKLSGAGGTDSRVVVFLDICFGKQLLHEQFTLSDRSDKNYGLLIGRRTIKHIGLLDVNKTFTMVPRCKKAS